MKKDNKLDFEITEDSLKKLHHISKNMEGKTFHFYTHILYDIRTKLGEGEKTYLEIGSFAGASISLVASHDYPTKCYTVDLGSPIPMEIVNKNVNTFKNDKSSFTYFKGNSQDKDIIDLVKNNVGEIDILFIDGDHTYKGVINDFENYSKLVKRGGYIIFDDYNDYLDSPYVKPAVNEIISRIYDDYNIMGMVNNSFKVGDLDNVGGNCFIIRKNN